MGQYMSLDPKYKTINISQYIHSLIYMTNINFLIHTHTGLKGQSVNLLPYNVRICSQLDCPNVQTLTKPQGNPVPLSPPIPTPTKQLNLAQNSGGIPLLWSSPYQPAGR